MKGGSLSYNVTQNSYYGYCVLTLLHEIKAYLSNKAIKYLPIAVSCVPQRAYYFKLFIQIEKTLHEGKEMTKVIQKYESS